MELIKDIYLNVIKLINFLYKICNLSIKIKIYNKLNQDIMILKVFLFSLIKILFVNDILGNVKMRATVSLFP